MFRIKRTQELSILAQGRGLVDGGVEINCHADDRRAFSLSGQSLILPSNSQSGRCVRPYRSHKLALPKTFVTKRGPMVLFTSPEDMIIGKSCQIHYKETVQKATSRLNTMTDLVDTTLNYDAEKDSGISDGETVSGDDCGTTYPGHFTNVYLRSLQQTIQKARQLPEDIDVEDIESKDSEVPLVSECDSGIGHSGRLSAHSHHSDGAVINIPDGRVSQDSRLSLPEEDHAMHEVETTYMREGESPARKDAALNELKEELSCYTVRQVKGNGTKRRAAKPGKKRAKAHESSKTKHQTKAANEESQPIKSRRKLKKKGKKEETSGNVEAKISLTVDAGDVAYCPVHPFDNSDQELVETQVTAIQMTHDNVEHAVNQHQQSFKAEQRRLEIERKRAEKKELERLKKEEEEKNLSLLNEQAARTSSSDIITEEEEHYPVVHESVLTQLNVGDGHQEVFAELEEAKLIEQRLLLAYSGERIEKSLCDAVDSAEKSIKKAKEAEERNRDAERLKLEQDQKRQRHSNHVAYERLYRLQDNRMKPEVVSPKSTSRPYVYSYFRYVPSKAKAAHEGKQKKLKQRLRHQK